VIEVERLTVTFGEGKRAVRAVDRVSFTAPTGGAFGLVGESGSGKSTVLRAIAGLVAEWSGRILLDGAPLGHSRPRQARRALQMVFQDPYGSLHPRHTVDRILGEPCRIHGLARVGERVEAALREVGLGPAFRYRYPHQLSGGQRQRVAIARALILRPRVLLLDEPTSALDASVQAEILNLLDDIRQKLGLTYVLVSHDLAVVAHLCDRLLVMRNGETVEETTSEGLRSDRATSPYTRALLSASQGFSRPETRATPTQPS
jgi:peptide/nickel transport system ATP-binding protein